MITLGKTPSGRLKIVSGDDLEIIDRQELEMLLEMYNNLVGEVETLRGELEEIKMEARERDFYEDM